MRHNIEGERVNGVH